MRKFILFIVLSFLLSFQIFAQSKEKQVKESPNFNGTWILEKIEPSKILNIKDYENYFLVVSFANNELKIKKSFAFKGESVNYDLTLFTDARGEKNFIPSSNNRNVERTSKTKIKKNKIISEYIYKDETKGKEQKFSGIEKYYLSKDGDELTLESIPIYADNLYGTFLSDLSRTTYVFRRKA